MWKVKAHERQIYKLSWAESGKLFATASEDNFVKIWCNETKKCINTHNNKDPVHTVAFCNNDTAVISGGINKQIFITSVDGSKSESFSTISVGDIKVDDEKHLIYVIEAAGNKIICYNILSKQELYRIEARENIISCDISLDKKFMLINISLIHPELQVWDLQLNQFIKRYTGHLQKKYYIKSVFGGYGQSFVASGSEDALIYIWNRSTEVLLNKLSGHTSIVNCVAWSPTDPSLLISGSDDYTIKVWDSSNWKVELTNEIGRAHV